MGQQGQVRLVNKQRQVIILEDGTVLTATSPQQLEVQSGNAVKVLFVEEGRKFTFRNEATGSRVNEQSLFEITQSYMINYLMLSTF